jgi:putative membrane protein
MNSTMRIALIATLVAAACGVVPPAVAQEKAAATKDMVKTEKHDGDSNALAIVATVDKDEIAAAKLALTKKMGKGANDYAHMMVTDHQANLTETKKLRGPGEASDKAAAPVKKDDEAMMAKLNPLEGKAFEQAYIDGMVEGHTNVLARLDTELLPNASDAKVKAHLQKTRDAVAKHLDAAKALQATP